MAVMINDDCIACGACDAECPNNAIYSAGDAYVIGGQEFPTLNEEHTYIVPDKCTECIGFNDEPQCIPACPTDAIVKDPERVETHEVLMARKEHLDTVGR